jgi:hypothetical protein
MAVAGMEEFLACREFNRQHLGRRKVARLKGKRERIIKMYRKLVSVEMKG